LHASGRSTSRHGRAHGNAPVYRHLRCGYREMRDRRRRPAASPPPLPPPQPRVKLNTHIRASPSAALYRFRPGTKSKRMAARPVPPLSVHQPLLPLGAVRRTAARKLCVSRKSMAVIAVEGAATLIVSVPVPFPPPLGTVMFG